MLWTSRWTGKDGRLSTGSNSALRIPVTFFILPLHNGVHFGITNRVEDK